MQLRFAVVVTGAPLPHAEIGRAVSALDVEHEILHEADLVVSVDDLKAECWSLNVERRRECSMYSSFAAYVEQRITGVARISRSGATLSGQLRVNFR